jgi:frataxin-like iron-binding protein CyaY
MIFYENMNNFKNDIPNPYNLNQLSINIYDDNENDIDFRNKDWTITLQVDIVSEFIINKKSIEKIYEDELNNIDA